MFKIEIAPEGYQLVGPGGEESGVTDYGDTAEVEVEDGKVYSTTVESKESALTEEQQVYLCLDEVPVVEEFDGFDVEDDDDEDDEDREDLEEVPEDAA